MTEIISVDIDSLDPHLDPKGNDQLVIRDKATGKDKKVGVSTLLGSGSEDDFPEWDKDTIFNTTDNKYCIEDDRFWKSLQDGNQNHRPSDDDPEDPAWWTEISESVGSAIREWAPGFYRAVDVVVKRNSKLYDLVSPVRPYESTNFETELAAGDWKVISGAVAAPQQIRVGFDSNLDTVSPPILKRGNLATLAMYASSKLDANKTIIQVRLDGTDAWTDIPPGANFAETVGNLLTWLNANIDPGELWEFRLIVTYDAGETNESSILIQYEPA